MEIVVLPATYRTAEKQIREALRLLDYHPQHRRIWLKPNLVTLPRWLPLGGTPRAAITDLRFIEALLRVFDGYEVTIAEGANPLHDTDEILEKSGVKALARRYGAQTVNLERTERFEVEWAYGTLRLPTLLQTHEYINVPKLKTHLLTGVSLGCKNQKGLLAGADKVRFHRDLDLHAAIRALTDVVQPALTIVDGIVGLEGPGPTLGRPRRVNAIVAGHEVRAVDVACCDLIGVSLDRVQHLERVPYRTVGRSVEELRVRFDAPTEGVVANVHLHTPPTVCSRCPQSVQDGLAVLWRSPYYILRGTWSCILHRTDILLGQMDAIPPTAHGRLICYGDCTRDLAEKHGLRFIPGCPPSVEESLKMY